VHNSLRAKHGASPLVWSTQLATQAQNWAKGCSHSHSIVSGPLSFEDSKAGMSWFVVSYVRCWCVFASLPDCMQG